MKSASISSSLLALAVCVTASPASMRSSIRQIGGFGVGPVCTSTTEPSVADVKSALDHWLNDVKNVNGFLDELHGELGNPTMLEGLALGALNNAKDEPRELGVLACIPALSDAAENAIASAAAGFGDNVVTPLTDITTNGAITAQVLADAHTINQFRCCTLLPDLDVLWEAAAADEGLVGQVTISPPRPAACGTITC